MKLYLLTYDNGGEYEANDHYTIGVFDNYDLACQFCIEQGFIETKTKGFYKKGEKGLYYDYESIEIMEIKLNTKIIHGY